MHDPNRGGDYGGQEECEEENGLCNVEFFHTIVSLGLVFRLLCEKFVIFSLQVCIEYGILKYGVVHIVVFESVFVRKFSCLADGVADVGYEVADSKSPLDHVG